MFSAVKNEFRSSRLPSGSWRTGDTAKKYLEFRSEASLTISILLKIQIASAYGPPKNCAIPSCRGCTDQQISLPLQLNGCPSCDICVECPVFKCSGCPSDAVVVERRDRNGCKICPMCRTPTCPMPSCSLPKCQSGVGLVQGVLPNSNCPGCPQCGCVKPLCETCPLNTVPDTRLRKDENGCALCPTCVSKGGSY